jgi:hypothetical protein
LPFWVALSLGAASGWRSVSAEKNFNLRLVAGTAKDIYDFGIAANAIVASRLTMGWNGPGTVACE